ncbi:MAG: dUTP diphosphatase [Deltaproteobacteria bacterium]|nr:dUTP diphosphatase [Deltaproteobacteria bacterium]
MKLTSFQFFLAPEAREKGIVFKAPRASDAGFDLASLDDVVVPPGGPHLLRTGIHLAIPEGFVGLVRDRSSMALKGLATVAGVIDASYRGEVKIVLHNLSATPLEIKSGERIAQCVVVPHFVAEVAEEVSSLEQLGTTERGAGGFGSTGR